MLWPCVCPSVRPSDRLSVCLLQGLVQSQCVQPAGPARRHRSTHLIRTRVSLYPRDAMRWPCVCPSVCPSVCLSQRLVLSQCVQFAGPARRHRSTHLIRARVSLYRARRYAMALCLSVCPYVRLSVCYKDSFCRSAFNLLDLLVVTVALISFVLE